MVRWALRLQIDRHSIIYLSLKLQQSLTFSSILTLHILLQSDYQLIRKIDKNSSNYLKEAKLNLYQRLAPYHDEAIKWTLLRHFRIFEYRIEF
jgi:hypothetical protein